MARISKILIIILSLFLMSCNQGPNTTKSTVKGTEAPRYYGSESKYIQIYNIIYINFALEKSKYKEALKLFMRDIDLMTDTKLFKKMARISMQLNKFQNTGIIISRWLELEPGDLQAHNIGISASLEEGDFQKAELIFQNYMNIINEDDKSYYARLITILSENRNRSNVIKFFDNYLEKHNNRLLTENFIELLRFYNQNIKALEYIEKIGTYNDRTLIRYKAASLSSINKPNEAIEVLNNYLKSKKNTDRQVQFELISIYLSIGDLNSAERLINDVLEIDSGNVDLIFRIGIMCYNSKAFDLAEKHLSYLLSMDLMSSDVNYFLGSIDYDKGNYLESIRHFERVTSGDRKFAAQIKKSSSIAKARNLSEAITFLESLKKRYVSDLMKVNILLAEINLFNEAERYGEVVNLVNRHIPEHKKNLRLIYARAMAYESMKNVELMEKDLKLILSIDSNNTNTLNALGYSLVIHTDRYDEAEKYIRKALEYDPGNAAILDSMGWVLYKKGDLENALYYIELAYNKDQDPEIVEHFCEILIKSGLHKKSREVMEREIRRNPENSSLLNNLTILHSDAPL
ncbi:MAG: tetratricopeptide repeat protein [Pseudomonadota bacterium]|nr:tetratricopeptide repeat protein [Pseudomonadota bacterium]